MSKREKDRLCVAEQNVQALAQRVRQLEEEMALCLKWMRVQAELEAEKRGRLFDGTRSSKPIPS